MDKPIEQLTDIQEQILNGHMLGDGCLYKPPNIKSNSYFQLTRKKEDRNYLLWSVKYFENLIYENSVKDRDRFDKRSNKFYYVSEFHTKIIPEFTEKYYYWYPEGNKIVPKDLVLTPLTIAVWLADDGTFSVINDKYLSIKISTNGFTYEDVVLLQYLLNKKYDSGFNIHQRIVTTDSGFNKVSGIPQFMLSSTNQNTIKILLEEIIDIFPLYRKIKKIHDYFYPDKDIIEKHILLSSINFAQKYHEVCPNCLYCHGKNVKTYGFQSGTKRNYYCNDCHKHYMGLENYEKIPKELKKTIDFSSIKFNKKENPTICIYCGSIHTNKNGVRKNQQRYKCSNCFKHFSIIKGDTNV